MGVAARRRIARCWPDRISGRELVDGQFTLRGSCGCVRSGRPSPAFQYLRHTRGGKSLDECDGSNPNGTGEPDAGELARPVHGAAAVRPPRVPAARRPAADPTMMSAVRRVAGIPTGSRSGTARRLVRSRWAAVALRFSVPRPGTWTASQRCRWRPMSPSPIASRPPERCWSRRSPACRGVNIGAHGSRSVRRSRRGRGRPPRPPCRGRS